MLKRLLQYSAFPWVFGGGLAAVWWGTQSGIEPSLLVFCISIAAGLIVTVLERLLPYEPAWSKGHDDVPTDILYMTFSLVGAPRLFEPLVAVGLLKAASALSLGWAVWPDQLPWAVQLVLAVIIGEFGSYWWHRLMHENPLFFRLHATHHSAPRLYWLNSTRFHPLDNVVMFALQLFPLLLMGAGQDVLAGFTVWSLLHGFFQHANVDIRLGPFNYFFYMAELHRWHHSRNMADANKNYGSNCILWDLVFGTFHWPRHRRPPADIGLDNLDEFPQRLVRQLLSPFFWPTGRR